VYQFILKTLKPCFRQDKTRQDKTRPYKVLLVLFLSFFFSDLYSQNFCGINNPAAFTVVANGGVNNCILNVTACVQNVSNQIAVGYMNIDGSSGAIVVQSSSNSLTQNLATLQYPSNAVVGVLIVSQTVTVGGNSINYSSLFYPPCWFTHSLPFVDPEIPIELRMLVSPCSITVDFETFTANGLSFTSVNWGDGTVTNGPLPPLSGILTHSYSGMNTIVDITVSYVNETGVNLTKVMPLNILCPTPGTEPELLLNVDDCGIPSIGASGIMLTPSDYFEWRINGNVTQTGMGYNNSIMLSQTFTNFSTINNPVSFEVELTQISAGQTYVLSEIYTISDPAVYIGLNGQTNSLVNDVLSMSLLPNPTFSGTGNEKIYIAGTLVIDHPMYAFENVQFEMNPCSKIEVDQGMSLTVKNSLLEKSCESMWYGVQMKEQSNIQFYNNVIKDAHYSLSFKGVNTSGIGSMISGNEFVNNYIGLYVEPNNVERNVGLTLRNNTFTSIDNLTFSPCSELPPIGGFPFAGILAYNMSDPLILDEATNDVSGGNGFNRLANGIIAYRVAALNISYTSFYNIGNYNNKYNVVNPDPGKLDDVNTPIEDLSYGVFYTNRDMDGQLNFVGLKDMYYPYNATFVNSLNGIYTDHVNVSVTQTDMVYVGGLAVEPWTLDNTSDTPQENKDNKLITGIRINSIGAGQSVDISNNEIGYGQAIMLYPSTPPSFEYFDAGYQRAIDVSNFDLASGLNISGNRIESNTNTEGDLNLFGDLIYDPDNNNDDLFGYLINIQGNLSALPQVTIVGNRLYPSNYGIVAVNCKNLVISDNRVLATGDLLDLLTNEPQNDVFQRGITVANCPEALVSCNKVTSPSNTMYTQSDIYSGSIYGINAQRHVGYSISSSPGIVVTCNEADRLRTGYNFLGVSTNTTYAGNAHRNHRRGLWVAGIVGIQGSSDFCNDNVWLNQEPIGLGNGTAVLSNNPNATAFANTFFVQEPASLITAPNTSYRFPLSLSSNQAPETIFSDESYVIASTNLTEKWFNDVTANSPANYSCIPNNCILFTPIPLVAEDPELITAEYLITRNQLLSDFPQASKDIANDQLYKRYQAYVNLVGSSIIDSFVNNNVLQIRGKLNEADEYMASFNIPIANIWRDSMLVVMNSIKNWETTIAIESDSATLVGLRVQLRNERALYGIYAQHSTAWINNLKTDFIGHTISAQNMVSSLEPEKDVHVVSHKVRDLYYKSIIEGVGVYSFDDITWLEAISNLCPYQYGPAVFQARSLYRTTGVDVHYSDTEICQAAGMQFLKSTEAAPTDLKVSPNPSDGSFSVEGYDSNGMFFLYNMLGVLVTQFDAEEGVTQINQTALPKGAYTLLWIAEGNQSTKSTLIIIK
jgi:hypothetical protein